MNKTQFTILQYQQLAIIFLIFFAIDKTEIWKTINLIGFIICQSINIYHNVYKDRPHEP